jgi:hypothetical protein
MKTLTKDSIIQIIGANTELQGDGSEHKAWSYECPICDHPMLFFKECRNPTGEAQCRLCGSIVKAETVQAIMDERVKDWENKKNNSMLRTLSYMGNGTVGKHKEPEE